MTEAYFESREAGIKRLQELRKHLMFASDAEEAKKVLEHFTPVISLKHHEVAKLNRAILQHLSPEQVKAVLDEILPQLEP